MAIPTMIRSLQGEVLSPPPVWFMRQAGRYLPEYVAVREEAGSFLNLCYDSEKAARVTLQPIERYDLDAAIIFADILLIPQALGQELTFQAGEGPKLSPLFSPEVLKSLSRDKLHQQLSPIYDTVSSVRAALSAEKALIGFAGAPWTVATYMVAGQGTKDPSAIRQFAYSHPEAFNELIRLLVDVTAEYLIRQAQAGAGILQIFDSWAAGLPERFFAQYCAQPVIEIAKRVRTVVDVPIIAFPRGAGPLYPLLANDPNIAGISIDTGMPWAFAAEQLSPTVTVQGGLDQLLIVQGGDPMLDAARELIETFKGKPYIFNIGHGFVPETPPEHVADLVKFIRQ
ncbi:MAG: uroporphyrinogen decarboxylase [Pseudomonadota bacterium]